MKSPAAQSFVLAVVLYSLIILAGYWLWHSQPAKRDITNKIIPVPVTLAMFAEPTPIIPPTPVILPEPIVEPKPVIEPEPIVKPKPVVEPEPIVEPKPVVEPEPIVEPKPIVKPPKKTPKPIKKPIKKPHVKQVKPKKIKKPIEPIQPKVDVVKQTTDTPPVIETPTVIEPPAKPVYSQQQTAKAEQLYLMALRKQIIAYAQDTYPRRAKRRRWEGNVLIQFELTPDGIINKLKIAESSGRNILDQAALEIFRVKMNNHFKVFPKEIDRAKWSIKVPVSYNLL